MATDPEQTAPSPNSLSRRDAIRAGAAGMAWLLTLNHIPPALVEEFARMTHNQPMTGPRLISMLQTERARWHALLVQIPAARMEEPGAVGTWSVKQLVAHLTWYEGRIVEGARQVLQTGKFVRPNGRLSMDERNIRIAEESATRPLSDVLAESDRVFSQVLDVITMMPTTLLNDGRSLGMPDDIVPWMAIANNSYGHYQEHEPDLRAWLAHAT
jgi:hypothetical protein